MRRLLPAAVATLALAGCAGNSTGLTGASSMRVEVEVYKGPLGQDKHIQLGEVAVVLEDAARTMKEWADGATFQRGSALCVTGKLSPIGEIQDRTGLLDCQALKEAIEAAEETVQDICRLRDRLRLDDITLRDRGPAPDRELVTFCDRVTSSTATAPLPIPLGTAPILQLTESEYSAAATEIARIAGNMKVKGFRVADHLIFYVPRSEEVRTLLSGFMLIAAEYSNQLQSRNGVLMKQLSDNKNRELLPVSDYLRDASPTDFLHLSEWYDATYDSNGINTPGQLDLPERIRMAERLFADYYWEKINEVHASGQGDVSMAFIKDDIGNWDLKSFSNDPAELLDAYSSAASAVISSIVDVAKDASGIGAGGQLLDLGNRLATGETSGQPNVGVLDAGALHARATRKLERLRTAANPETEKELLAAKEKAAASETTAAGAVATRTGTVAERQRALSTASDGLAACRAKSPPDSQTPPCNSENTARDTAAGNLRSAEVELATAEADLAKAQVAAATATAALVDHRKAAQAEVRAVLDDHLELIATLQEAVAGTAASDPAGVPTTIPGGSADLSGGPGGVRSALPTGG